MEEKELEIQNENVEITGKSPVNSERKPPNEKKNTIIIFSLAGLLIASLTATLIYGSILQNQPSASPSYTFNWSTNRQGFYDKNNNYISLGDLHYFDLEKDSVGEVFASLNSVEAPEGAVTYVIPSTMAFERDGQRDTYKIQKITPKEGSTIFSGGTGSTIEAIYTQSLYKEIGDYSFAGLTNLKKVSFMSVANARMTIGEHAFSGDISLSDIEFPKHLHEIKQSAFEDCSSLEEITLPKGLVRLGDAAFKNSGLKNIKYDGNEQEWKNVIKGSSWDEGLSDLTITFLK